MSIAKLVTAPIPATEHADAILELAFLTSAADGSLDELEVAAFRELVGCVRGREATQPEIEELLGRFIVALHGGSGVADRLRTVAKAIPADLREIAFKVAVALSLVDHDESEDEDELVGILGATLGLAEKTIALSAAARDAIGAS